MRVTIGSGNERKTYELSARGTREREYETDDMKQFLRRRGAFKRA